MEENTTYSVQQIYLIDPKEYRYTLPPRDLPDMEPADLDARKSLVEALLYQVIPVEMHTPEEDGTNPGQQLYDYLSAQPQKPSFFQKLNLNWFIFGSKLLQHPLPFKIYETWMSLVQTLHNLDIPNRSKNFRREKVGLSKEELSLIRQLDEAKRFAHLFPAGTIGSTEKDGSFVLCSTNPEQLKDVIDGAYNLVEENKRSLFNDFKKRLIQIVDHENAHLVAAQQNQLVATIIMVFTKLPNIPRGPKSALDHGVFVQAQTLFYGKQLTDPGRVIEGKLAVAEATFAGNHDGTHSDGKQREDYNHSIATYKSITGQIIPKEAYDIYISYVTRIKKEELSPEEAAEEIIKWVTSK